MKQPINRRRGVLEDRTFFTLDENGKVYRNVL